MMPADYAHKAKSVSYPSSSKDFIVSILRLLNDGVVSFIVAHLESTSVINLIYRIQDSFFSLTLPDIQENCR